MYKIAILDKNSTVKFIHENVTNLEIEPNGMDVTYFIDNSACRFSGVRNFAVIEGETPLSVGQTLTNNEVSTLDLEQFKKVDLLEEIKKLKKQQAEQNIALVNLFQNIPEG